MKNVNKKYNQNINIKTLLKSTNFLVNSFFRIIQNNKSERPKNIHACFFLLFYIVKSTHFCF